MQKIFNNEVTTPILLSVITILLGLTTWFGYTFANHMIAVMTEHEQRLDQNEIDIAILKRFDNCLPGEITP